MGTMKLESLYRSLMAIQGLRALTPKDALRAVGTLIDVSLSLCKAEGITHALDLIDRIDRAKLSPQETVVLNYFTANAWANLRRLKQSPETQSWHWEQPEVEKELLFLRRANRSDGFKELPDERKCQILTNLANTLNHVGRCSEAIEYWDRALHILPQFGMAHGSKGVALSYYARNLYDKGHILVILQAAKTLLQHALSDVLESDAKEGFSRRLDEIESVLCRFKGIQPIDLDNHKLDGTDAEIAYRRWCLEKRLFLNPLNDLGAHSIAARDVLMTPSIVVKTCEGPKYQGCFNQLKQEYVSARFLYYEGVRAKTPHFSDVGVMLFDTLDYASNSLAAEKVRMAFRMSYSLLDKVAFFVNSYWDLKVPERAVAFRNIWYQKQDRKQGLRSDIKNMENWPLRGLFWLGKDLFEDKPGFKDLVEPDAQKLHEIRQHLEHKYLKLHDYGAGVADSGDQLGDTLAYSLNRHDFEAKMLRMLKLARSALMYLSMAMHREENVRSQLRGSVAVLPMSLPLVDDNWKR